MGRGFARPSACRWVVGVPPLTKPSRPCRAVLTLLGRLCPSGTSEEAAAKEVRAGGNHHQWGTGRAFSPQKVLVEES